MESSTLLHNLSPAQLNMLFQGLQNQLTEIKEHFVPKSPVDLLSRIETAQFLKCNLSTLHNWVKNGTLIPYGINNRVYFKRSEIELALLPIGKNRGGRQ